MEQTLPWFHYKKLSEERINDLNKKSKKNSILGWKNLPFIVKVHKCILDKFLLVREGIKWELVPVFLWMGWQFVFPDLNEHFCRILFRVCWVWHWSIRLSMRSWAQQFRKYHYLSSWIIQECGNIYITLTSYYIIVFSVCIKKGIQVLFFASNHKNYWFSATFHWIAIIL